MHKNSLNNFICHLSWFKKLSLTHTHPLKTSHELSKPYELLFFELESLKSWMWHKMLNVNWEKIHSIILSVTCHGLRNFPLTHTHPLKTSHELSWIFETLWVIIFWVRVTHKILNVNWEKIHSIILSVTCHGFRNFPQLIHIPSYPFMNFQNPASYYCLPRGRHSEAAHEKRLLCAQKCTRGGVGWGGSCRGGVGWKKMQPQNKGPGM